jgi:hypothetical protein
MMCITSAMAYILPARILILCKVKRGNESCLDALQIKDYILGNYALMFYNRRLRTVTTSKRCFTFSSTQRVKMLEMSFVHRLRFYECPWRHQFHS